MEVLHGGLTSGKRGTGAGLRAKGGGGYGTEPQPSLRVLATRPLPGTWNESRNPQWGWRPCSPHNGMGKGGRLWVAVGEGACFVSS